MKIFALTTPKEDAMGFWEEFWHEIDYGTYSNLGLDTGNVRSVGLIVLGVFIGIIIACVAMTYNKQVLGGAVRKMLSDEGGCRSAENAKTLAELGLIKNPFIKSAVQRSASLRRVVRCVGEEEFYRAQAERKAEYEKKRAESDERLPKFRELEYCVDANSDHFYIPEELCDMAEHKFEGKGFSWRATIIGIILLCIAFFIVLLVLPKVLEFIDEFLGTFKKSGY